MLASMNFSRVSGSVRSAHARERKGARASERAEGARPLLRHCRRLAALTLAEQLTVEGRWIPMDRNFADGPSPGRGPAPCGNDLDGIYEGLLLPQRERRALGRVFANLQRQQVVKDFEASLLAQEGSISLPFVFQGVF